MVLQDVNDAPPDGFSDNPLPDQNDPYASSSSPPGTRFDSSGLPQPLPIIGTFMGFSDDAVRFKTETTLRFAERKAGRQLNPTEAQALAFHIYQLERTKSYFAATGAAAGAYRAYVSMGTMRYPFYQPKIGSVDPNKFAFVRGPMAQVARHTWRFSLYLLVAGQAGSMLGQLIAQPLAAVNTSKDPKLEQFGLDLMAAANAEQMNMTEKAQEIQARKIDFERQTRDRSGMGPSPQAAWRKQPSAQSGEDDMSPTTDNEAWGAQSSTTGSWDSFSSQSDQSVPQRSQGPPSSETWNRRPPPNRAASDLSSPFGDDDASPTGGMFQDEVNSSSQPQQQARPGESTWDRLRRGGAPIPGQTPPPHSRRAEPERRRQMGNSTVGETFTFVDGEEERKREKERAQREFDERIELERQGRDFTGEGKKW
ncbi:hypothetical protein BDU57DRAFT_517927 [Ampelomyces quisqualis]|uniref:Uncharacterized protein n=1 Tax=Ampelomyces quisqualis TaxID=50730 RepID=A0A6A5QKA3_AMPQU|nr:hypothetical protein BDU57DRAFT_517927 [Ampelomyces quisqualis]